MDACPKNRLLCEGSQWGWRFPPRSEARSTFDRFSEGLGRWLGHWNPSNLRVLSQLRPRAAPHPDRWTGRFRARGAVRGPSRGRGTWNDFVAWPQKGSDGSGSGQGFKELSSGGWDMVVAGM